MDDLLVGNPIVADNVTLVPVERCYFHSDNGERGRWLLGIKEPYAIIVRDATGIRAFNTKADEIAVQSLIQKVPALGALLEM